MPKSMHTIRKPAMVSTDHNRGDARLHDKLQLLRSITHSGAMNDTSVVLDATNYIRELQFKVERLKEEIATAESSSSIHQKNLWPRVSVETLEKGGFQVNIRSGKSCPRLLVSILATFEDLGLTVLEARVSSAHTFHLQALGSADHREDDEENMDAEMVQQAIWNTIKSWSQRINEE